MEIVKFSDRDDRGMASDDLRVVGDEQGECRAILFSSAQHSSIGDSQNMEDARELGLRSDGCSIPVGAQRREKDKKDE